MGTTVPLFGLGQQTKSPTVTAQRHLNLYCELSKDPDKGQFAFYGTPGLSLKTAFGDTPPRGWIAIGSLYYVVHRGKLYSVNNAGTKVTLGTLNTVAGRVDMAYDGAVLLIVDGTNLYTLTLPSTFAQVVGAFVPNGANTCAWLDGQFLVDDGVSDSWYISPNGTAWDALDFTTAESNPDGLVRVFVDSSQVILFGENTTEYDGDSGAQDFPFATVQGATQEYGLAARWSVCKFNSGVAALMKPKAGGVQMMFITGYVPKPISQQIDAIIARYASVSDATAFSYMLDEHPMLQVNFPTPGASWLYDASTGLWSPLEYGLNGERHRGEMQLDFLNQSLIADYENGNIYVLEPDMYTDNGTQIAREIVGRHTFNGDNRMTVDELYVDMETGVGLSGNAVAVTENVLNLPGASGDYASTPDSVANSITGDIDILVKADATSWGASGMFVSKAVLAGSQISYYFAYSGNVLTMITSANGSATVFSQSTEQIPFANGSGGWLRVTVDVDNGASGNTVTFYTATDGVTWARLGAAVVNVGTTSIFNSTAEVEIGAYDGGGFGRFTGKIYRAQIYNGIDGTLACDFNPADAAVGATTVVSSSTGETYTLHGNAAIIAVTTPATIGANPQAMLQVSKNNGHTWSSERWRDIGKIGEYLARVVWRRIGLARDFLFKIRITDPVKVVITYAAMRVRGGR